MNEAEIMRISHAFAEACADCEDHRVSEPYPQPKWKAAGDRRRALLSEWMSAAKRLTARKTDPDQPQPQRLNP